MDLHLYPTALSRDRAIREAVRQAGVLYDHRHFTYPELLERLYRAEGLSQRSIEDPARTVFVRHCLSTVLGKVPSPGLVAAYREVMEELKGSGLEAEDFARCIQLATPDLSHDTQAALHQLREVFQNYQTCLAQASLVDRGDRNLAVLSVLIQHVRGGSKPALLRDVRRVILHDVYHLSLVHYALVSTLIRLVEDGGVLRHFSDGINVDAVQFAEFTWQRFVADEALAAYVLPEFAKPRRRGGNLEALSERLFTSGPLEEPIEPDGTLAVIAAPGRMREVESIARRVRELLGQGVSPEQVAIVVRNVDVYGDLLQSAFRRYRIPVWFRRGIPLFHVPLIKTLFSLLELAGSTYPRKALLKILTSAYLRHADLWPDDVVGLVNAVGYLDHTHASLPALLDEFTRRHPPDAGDTGKAQSLALWVDAFQTALAQLVEGPRPFLTYLEALKALLADIGFFNALGMQPEVPVHVTQRDRDALRLTFETLREGAEALRLLGDTPMEFAEFRRLASDLVSEVTLNQPLQDDGAVRVLGVYDVLGLDFAHVFVPGVADAEFPMPYTEHPLLNDVARHALNRAARLVLAEKFAGLLERRLLGKVLLTTAEQAREEPLLFFLALESATHGCVLSYPTRTSDGETVFPSMFVDEVLRHFRHTQGEAAVLTRIPAQPSVPPLPQCLEPGELLRRAALAWRTTSHTPLDEALHAQGVMVERLRQAAKVEGARKGYLLAPGLAAGIDPAFFGDLGGAVDLRSRFLDPQHAWSPTMLEQAAACPFAFFAESALHLQPREEPDYDVSPLVLGELAHDILAEFFAHELPRDSRVAVQRMQVIAARVLDRHGRGPGLGHPGFWQVRKAELLRALADVATHAAQWAADDYRTLYHEHSMRGEVPCGDWSLQLKGRVDRVAIREGPSGIHSLQVQDFKYSGNIDRYRGLLKLDALGQTSFQLPVYLYLTLQQLEQDGHRVAADAELLLEYLLLKDPGQKAWGIAVSRAFLSPDHPGGLLHGIRRVTEEAIAGRFAPRPAEGKQTCTYCAYAALCRYWTSGAGMDVEAGIEASRHQGIE